METIEKNDIFELAYRFVTETSENIFLTGKAGTGKTTFLKYLKEHGAKNMVVAAPTGVAAINSGGVTLHSLLQLPFHPFIPTTAGKRELISRIRFRGQRLKLLRAMELLVIDEISMVRADTLDAVDTLLRTVRHNQQRPFGGVQVLFIGDLHQLPPVAQTSEWNLLREYYESPFFFDSAVIRSQTPLLIELHKIYRQKQEQFIELLNKVRTNNLSSEDLTALNERYCPASQTNEDKPFITLTTHNKQAEQINDKRLYQLDAPVYTFKAETEGEFPEHLYPADPDLKLKEGAQVMFLKNDTQAKRYFNGKIGLVKKLAQDKIKVDCDGDEIEVLPETWENNKYTIHPSDGKLEQQVIGRFIQYPLRLAWAITIHKSQGLTFDNVMIDAASAFSSGQVYVALSRCTSLDGIVLLSKIPAAAIQSNEHVIRSQESFTHKGSLQERFGMARKIFTIEIFEELFLFKDICRELGILKTQIAQLSGTLNPDTQSWIENLIQKQDLIAKTGSTFVRTTEDYLQQESVVENNIGLQGRLKAAATYFLPVLDGLRKSIREHPVSTEHRETAAKLDELLVNAWQVVNTNYNLILYCHQDFSITGFLKHKLNITHPPVSITCYVVNRKANQIEETEHNELLASLKNWRNRICAQTGLPVYRVANQKTLEEICEFLPSTEEELLEIKGFGATKVKTFGEDILEEVLKYCERYDLKSRMHQRQSDTKKVIRNQKKPADTMKKSFELLQQGFSISEIAARRNLSKGTIEHHMCKYIATGELALDKMVDTEKIEIIREAINRYGFKSLKTLKENLPESCSYSEIRMVCTFAESKEND